MADDPQRVGLPPRLFLYTIDQIATILAMKEDTVHIHHVHHEGRDIGIRERHQMLARNVAAPDQAPDWRVAETELIRWLKIKGFKFYNSGTLVK